VWDDACSPTEVVRHQREHLEPAGRAGRVDRSMGEEAPHGAAHASMVRTSVHQGHDTDHPPSEHMEEDAAVVVAG
jgi:hypothetical protein